MRHSKPWRSLLVATTIGGLLLTSLTACSSETDAEGHTMDSSIPKVDGNTFGKQPKIAAGKKGNEPKKLVKATLIKGKGNECSATDSVLADYEGQLYNGSKFDSSWENNGGKPVFFDMTNLIKGWQQGLTGAKEGSRTVLVLPPELGYGKEGMPPKIPGNSTLVFVVDIHKCVGKPKIHQEFFKSLTPADPAPETPGIKVSGKPGAQPTIEVDWNALKQSGKEVKEPMLFASGTGPEIKANDLVALVVSQIDEGNPTIHSQWGNLKEVAWVNVSEMPKLVGMKTGSRLLAYLQPKKADPAKQLPVDQPATVGVIDIVDVQSMPAK